MERGTWVATPDGEGRIVEVLTGARREGENVITLCIYVVMVQGQERRYTPDQITLA